MLKCWLDLDSVNFTIAKESVIHGYWQLNFSVIFLQSFYSPEDMLETRVMLK